jgi:hypothetical protein
MTSDQRRSGPGGGSPRRASLSQAGLALRGKEGSQASLRARVFFVPGRRLNRYFSQLVAALGKLGMPIVVLVMGDGQAGDVQDLVEIVSAPSASQSTRLRALSAEANRHADADIVDAHFALSAFPPFFGRRRRRPLVVHFQRPWADESVLAGRGRLKCALKRRLRSPRGQAVADCRHHKLTGHAPEACGKQRSPQRGRVHRSRPRHFEPRSRHRRDSEPGPPAAGKTRAVVSTKRRLPGCDGRASLPLEGQNLFFQAFAKAFPDGEEVAVLVGPALIGEDELERQLRELVCDLGIEDGRVPGIPLRGLRGAQQC